MKFVINKVAVGDRIFNIRTKMNLTLEEFGKIFNAGKSNVQKWEIGSSLPNKKRLGLIAKVGKVSYNELLYGKFSNFLELNFELGLDLIDKKIRSYTPTYQLESIKNQLSYYWDNFDKGVDFASLSSEELTEKLKEFAEGLLDNFAKDNRRDYSLFVENIDIVEKYFDDVLETSDGLVSKKIPSLSWYLADLDKCVPERIIYNRYIATFFTKYLMEYEDVHYVRHKKHLMNTSYSTFLKSIKKYPETASCYQIFDMEFSIHGFENIMTKENKFGIKDYDFIISMYVEAEDTLYYLAHYSDEKNIPLNNKVDYFVINDDLSFSIEKLESIPHTKYYAPVLGRMD